MNIHEWAARECGMRIIDGIWCDKHDNGILPLGDNWTLDDACCREIVREHFKIETNRSQWGGVETDYWYATRFNAKKDEYDCEEKGKTIAEAEINCIEAIREAQDK